MLGYDEVADIIRIIDASSCAELILETVDFKLVIRRHGAPPAEPRPHPAPTPSVPPASPPVPPAVRPAPPRGGEVRAPMVGVFYRAPAPGAPPFVEIGSLVARGDKLCIIEVMKLFTTIAAEEPGRVVAIPATDGGLVEYGQIMFVLEPL